MMLVRKGSDSAIIEPLEIVLSPIEDDPRSSGGAAHSKRRHAVFTGSQDLLVWKRLDKRSQILNFLPVHHEAARQG
jgi:hypothetical protein